MLHLRTLGGLWLERDDGSLVDVRARWLALLAFVAAGEKGGVSRDQLLGVLWPDLDQPRASHNLSQAIYSLRLAVGDDISIADTKTIRLDSAKVSTDLEHLRAAVREKDGGQATRAYRGPFLTGFYLEGSPEFERWCSDTRTRVARDAEDLIEQYADACAQNGAAAESRASWRRLTELDPSTRDSRISMCWHWRTAGTAGALCDTARSMLRPS